MEPDAKSIVDHQRILNPKMKDAVRTEILKLLENGSIMFIVSLRKEVLLLFLMIKMNVFHKEQ